MAGSINDFVIVGGGIVGLATAMELTRCFPDKQIAIIEKEQQIARHQSTHNSGVIHSGIYYRPGSLKAKTCVEGVNLIKAFCREHSIPMQETGKVIVATDAVEIPRLENLQKRAAENGISGVETLDAEELKQREPYANGLRALWVPTTAIVSYEGVCNKFAEIISARNGKIYLEERVKAIKVQDEEITVYTSKKEIGTRYLINCAGLLSDKVAQLAGINPGLRIVPFRGEYYKFKQGKNDYVRGLIYPVPDPELPFLGVHYTKMIDGGVEIGPNAVLAFNREGYRKTSFSLGSIWNTLTYGGFWKMSLRFWKIGIGEMYRSLSKKAFMNDARRMLPAIQDEDVEPYKTGVRAQAVAPDGALIDDFWVKDAHRMIHVLNAPSPAATACICIGRQIVDMAKEKFAL